jgi:RHS repeat-associated protein
MKSLYSTPWRHQVISLMLLPLQVFVALPLSIITASSVTTVLSQAAASSASANMQVRHGARDVSLIVPALHLSSSSTDEAIEMARVFPEPLLPTVAGTSSDNQALRRVLRKYYDNHQVSDLNGFVNQYPKSRWSASLDFNLGLIHFDTGYLSLALQDWQKAWDLSKDSKDPRVHALADRSVGELLQLNAELGRMDDLKHLFDETKGRGLIGSGAELAQSAREGYQIMKTHPTVAFKCGPFALDSIRTATKNRHPRSAIVEGAMSTTKGTSLAMVKVWSDKLGMNLQMAKRASGAILITPAVMHWKLGHFAALVRQKKDRYLIQDPTFGGTELWVKAGALEAETSGYFLIPAGPLPAGWTTVTQQEASQVWGRGGSKATDKNNTKNPCKCPKGCTGMTVASYFPMLATLHLEDRPLVYNVPVGPQINLTVGYSYEEANQPANLPFSNFGNDWVFQYLSYATVDASQNVTIALRGGGTEVYNYSTFDDVNNVFAPDVDSQAQLFLISSGVYERCLKDGSKEIYSQPDGTGRIFLKQIFDPQNNSLVLVYDSNFRLTYVQDEIGQMTTFAYLSNTLGAAGFYKIQTLTDPFGRSASFQYDSNSNQLVQITDAVGITSKFTYDNNYLVDSLTTPYGRTLFSQYVPASDSTGEAMGLKITYPDGTQAIVENSLNHELNTYQWSRKQSPYYPDETKATIIHWLQEAAGNVMSNVPQFDKNPLEGSGTWLTNGYSGNGPLGAITYSYQNAYSITPGSIDGSGNPIPIGDQVPHRYTGISNRPTQISRTLDDGTTQAYNLTYNNFGLKTSIIDPLGRTFNFLYDASNNIDLLEIRQAKNSNNDLLAKFTYNDQHEPLTYQDGSGQKASYSYNSRGQISTKTDVNSNITTYSYNSNGYLISITGPLSGSNDKTTFTYDGYGRVYTVSNSEGYTLTFAYDNLDRIVSVTYPDETFEETVWNNLDPIFLRDRLGEWTRQQFDSLDQLVLVSDPLGRNTKYQWCTCGALGSMTDPAGNVTTWSRDIQGRSSQKIYADSSAINYTYENDTSRLKSVQDALSKTKTYSYNADNTLSEVAYSDGTPNVTYTYDSLYPRLTSVANSWGTVGYSYYSYITNPFGATTTGAGQIDQVTNSALGSTATITMTYDDLGRLINRAVNASGNSTTWTYDAMSRLTGVSNPLGLFGYAYLDQGASGGDKGTTLLSAMTYPNGQATNFSYYLPTGDERLQQIQNLNASSSVISQFNYAYDPKGQITSWKQQADSNAATRYDIAFDAAGQLISAVNKTDSTNAILKQYYYGYDSAANRTSEQIDAAVTGTSVNNLNQITGTAAGGATRFQGTISEPGTVQVNGHAAAMSTGTNFVANPTLSPGTNTVAVVATDGGGNATTNNYQVVVAGGATSSPYYDAAGNMLNNGNGQTYQWDAENRLTQITQGGNTYQFAYDGLGRRVSETDNGTLTKQWLWVGSTLAEERTSSGTVVTKRFFEQGEQISGSSYYYTRDHLGSVREMTDASGNIQARYSYDPYGRVIPVGTINLASDFQYAGYYEHAASGLNLNLFRAYDPNTAKWLSRDPIGINGGINLYGYVGNGPINLYDPYGLNGWWAAAGAAAGFALSLPADAGEDFFTGGAGVLANPATTAGLTTGGAALGQMIDNALNGNSMSMSAAGSGAGSGGGNSCPNNNGGNLKAVKPSKLDADGIDAEAVKEDFLGNSGGQYNVSVDGDGNVTLTPVQPGGGENVPTGLNYNQLPDFYPAGG